MNAKIVITLVVSFVAGSFIASPELRAYAANTVGSIDIIDGSIQSVDIGNGQVKTADIAGAAVISTKIKNGEVKKDDIAPGSIGAIFRTETDVFALSPGQSSSNQVFCDTGEYAVSAGYYLSTNVGGDSTKIIVTTFYQVNPGKDWHIGAKNTGAVQGYVNTYLTCMDLTP